MYVLLQFSVSPQVFSGVEWVVHVARSLVFCVVFCRSLFVLLSLFFWPLCCLFFEVRFLITSFTSSNLLQEDTSIYEHDSVSKSSYDMARHVYIVIFNHFVSLLYYLEIICLAIVPLVSDFRKWLIACHNNYSKQPKL